VLTEAGVRFSRTRLFIAAATREDANPMKREVEQIVRSFRFESVVVR
jgi:hypothetical protein